MDERECGGAAADGLGAQGNPMHRLQRLGDVVGRRRQLKRLQRTRAVHRRKLEGGAGLRPRALAPQLAAKLAREGAAAAGGDEPARPAPRSLVGSVMGSHAFDDGSPAWRESVEAAFALCDKNEDGDITKAELLNWLRAGPPGVEWPFQN